MSFFYVKRGQKIIGPLTPVELQPLLDSGKLKKSDFFATAEDGPWQLIANNKGDLPFFQDVPSPNTTRGDGRSRFRKISLLALLVLCTAGLTSGMWWLLVSKGEEDLSPNDTSLRSEESAPAVHVASADSQVDKQHDDSPTPEDRSKQQAPRPTSPAIATKEEPSESQDLKADGPFHSSPDDAAPPKSRPFSELIELVEPAVVKLEVTTASANHIGSGFVVSPDGVVVTNYHVMENAKEAVSIFNDKTRVSVVGVWHMDAQRDIAIIQLETKGKTFHVLPVSKTLPKKGESVFAFGAPRGLDFTVSDGLVSGIRESKDLPRIFQSDVTGTWIQSTAPISPGNSGGPLVGSSGSVIAMNTWYITKGQNLNFAISCVDIQGALTNVSTGKPKQLAIATTSEKAPSNNPQDQSKQLDSAPIDPAVIADVMNHRNWFGVSTRPAKPTGEQVTEVYAESPAAEASVRPADIITAINGKSLSKDMALASLLPTMRSGDSLKVSLRRPQKMGSKFVLRPRTLRVKIHELITKKDLSLIENGTLKRRQREFLARYLLAYRREILARTKPGPRKRTAPPKRPVSQLLRRGATSSILSAMKTGDGVTWGPAFGDLVDVEIGEIGYFRGLKVQQVVGPAEVAVRLGSATVVIITDSTTLSDNSPLGLSSPCQIVGAKFYKKVFGGTKKVFLALPADFTSEVAAVVDVPDDNETPRTTDQSDAMLFKLCRRGRNGTILHFVAQPRLNDSDLIRIIGDNKELKHINLSRSSVSDNGIEKIKGLRSIETLDLRETSITAAGIAVLEGLELKTLWLPKQARTDEGLKHYLKTTAPNPRLSLQDWNVTDDGLAYLQSSRHLHQLILDGTRVTDQCMPYLSRLRDLKSLNLCNTKVTDKGIVQLKELKSLRDLDVSNGSQVTINGAGLLQMYLPKCNIRLK